MKNTRNRIRQLALEIFYEGIKKVDPAKCIASVLSRSKNEIVLSGGKKEKIYNIGSRGVDNEFERLLLLGVGKGAAPMAQMIESMCGDILDEGLIIVKDGHSVPLEKTQIIEASHPIPDERGVQGAQKLYELAGQADEKTLVIFLLSGGGSALLPLPVAGITLEEKQKVTELLLKSGADIREMNIVRKHLSQIKGGLLARQINPASSITLVLSDVVGDHFDRIASGPTVADPSTFMDAYSCLAKRNLIDKVPTSVRLRLEKEAFRKDSTIERTPQENDEIFKSHEIRLIGSNRSALGACCAAAQNRGFSPLLLSSSIEGETGDIARLHAAIARDIVRYGTPLSAPACIVSGGETTVTLKGRGKGGRNLEFALAAAFGIHGINGLAILSAGTDGTDGPTDAAGALVFGDTLSRAQQKGLNAEWALENNDSYPFFDALGDLVKTGPTFTNVMDIHLILVDNGEI